MSLSNDEMDFDDDLVVDVRGQQALGGHDDDDDGELGQFVLTQKPDPDGHTFMKFQQAATFSNDQADAHAMKAAVQDARQAAAEQAILRKQVDEIRGERTAMDIRTFYFYMNRSPSEQAIIDRYILSYLDPKTRSSLVPPYGPIFQME